MASASGCLRFPEDVAIVVSIVASTAVDATGLDDLNLDFGTLLSSSRPSTVILLEALFPDRFFMDGECARATISIGRLGVDALGSMADDGMTVDDMLADGGSTSLTIGLVG